MIVVAMPPVRPGVMIAWHVLACMLAEHIADLYLAPCLAVKTNVGPVSHWCLADSAGGKHNVQDVNVLVMICRCWVLQMCYAAAELPHLAVRVPKTSRLPYNKGTSSAISQRQTGQQTYRTCTRWPPREQN